MRAKQPYNVVVTSKIFRGLAIGGLYKIIKGPFTAEDPGTNFNWLSPVPQASYIRSFFRACPMQDTKDPIYVDTRAWPVFDDNVFLVIGHAASISYDPGTWEPIAKYYVILIREELKVLQIPLAHIFTCYDWELQRLG
jgi:hypothetical protein